MGDTAPLIRMRGGGYYSDHTIGAADVIAAATPLALRALAEIPLTDTQPLSVADFGAADGGTSLALHRAVVAAARAARPARAVAITYTDLPHNDFSVLFRRVLGLLPDERGFADDHGVFVFASGASFYRPILLPGILHLGFSATAMHWLSQLPALLPDAVHAALAEGPAREALRAQALADWDHILTLRAAELAPGGQLVLANFCTDAAGHYLGWTGGRNMHDRFAHHWRALVRDGTITEAEFTRATFQQYYKTLDEFTAPFAAPDGAGHRAGLRLLEAFTVTTPCPYAARFRAEGDAAAFARAYVPTLRSWSETTFASALDPARPETLRQAIVDRFYAAYEQDVAAAPAGHAMDYVHCFLRCVKG